MEESQAKEKLLAEVAKLWPAAKGSVRRYGQKCKNINCEKCKSGERHPIWQITYYENGRQRSKHIPKDLVDDFKQALENGRKIEALLVQSGLEFLEELKRK